LQDTDATVLLGDLNDVPAWSGFAPLFAHFDDTWAEAGDGTPGYTQANPSPNRRIDYVLVSPDVAVDEARTLARLESDHRPAVAELRLPGAAVGVSAERP
jgi:endonuclease/exonuclease/phosphatase (EEP) superfamily protein YafD